LINRLGKKEQGWSDEKIRRANTTVRKNTRMKKQRNEDNQQEEGIIWCADDPSMYSFVVKPRRRRGDAEAEGENEEEGVTHTIASYFDMRYGIRLRYPNVSLHCLEFDMSCDFTLTLHFIQLFFPRCHVFSSGNENGILWNFCSKGQEELCMAISSKGNWIITMSLLEARELNIS